MRGYFVVCLLLSWATLFASCGAADGASTPGDAHDDTYNSTSVDPQQCVALFGLPNEHTGLSPEQCRPECDCGGFKFKPPAYSEKAIAAIEAMKLLDPVEEPAIDPYAHPEAHVALPGKVCGVVLDKAVPKGYHLATFDGPKAALAAGAIITHWDACGVCSPLVNLAVYMRHPDLTAPVRECGIKGMLGGDEVLMQCLLDLGFDRPCARIWFYNTKNTQAKCQAVCLAMLDRPYHNPDGSLNDCLMCDEEQSGPVFKAVAGRTRRNTGLASSMCRPCSEVHAIVHEYGPVETTPDKTGQGS